MRTYVRALEQPDDRRRGAAPAARISRAGGRAPLRRPGGAETRFYEVQARSLLNRVPGALGDAVPLDDQPVQGMHACMCLLLRAAHTQVSRLRRRARLRARDRRQDRTRPRCCGPSWRATLVAGRARRARHEHRPLSVGRGTLPADGGDLGGAARRRQPLFGVDEVAAAAARSRADARDRRAHELQRLPFDPDARRESVASDRAAHAEPAGRGWRRSPSSTARASRPAC